jgi:hypothetical protein
MGSPPGSLLGDPQGTEIETKHIGVLGLGQFLMMISVLRSDLVVYNPNLLFLIDLCYFSGGFLALRLRDPLQIRKAVLGGSIIGGDVW